jgi:hypothetical protein
VRGAPPPSRLPVVHGVLPPSRFPVPRGVLLVARPLKRAAGWVN